MLLPQRLLGSMDSQLHLLLFMSVERRWASRDVVMEARSHDEQIE